MGALGLAVLTALLGCSDESRDPAFVRGRDLYQNLCTICHDSDPSAAGVLGPAVAGASRELLEAKVLRGEYPPGHTPVRDTQQMPLFPYLEPRIADIAVFLAAAK